MKGKSQDSETEIDTINNEGSNTIPKNTISSRIQMFERNEELNNQKINKKHKQNKDKKNEDATLKKDLIKIVENTYHEKLQPKKEGVEEIINTVNSTEDITDNETKLNTGNISKDNAKANNSSSKKSTLVSKPSIYSDSINEKWFSFDEAISYVKIWIDYNLIDFTLTYEILKWLRQDDNAWYLKFLRIWKEELKEKIKKYNETSTYFDFSKCQNYLIFLMIITLNLNSPLFVKLFFEKTVSKAKSDFEILIELLNTIKDSEKRKALMGILNNLFLQEYKDIFFRNPRNEELEQLFIERQLHLSNQFSDINSVYAPETYWKMFDILLNFSISYENFFVNHRHQIKEEDKPAYKLCIAQSVIRTAFSKEKEKCYSSWITPKSVHPFYEYELINKVIEKDMSETRARFGDEYKTLFRKEDLCDDIIKYMFFIFGNTMLIESFIKPVLNIFRQNPEREITKKDYSFIMKELNTNWMKTIPNILKILLKLVYVKVRQYFTIEANNYSPLYTLLIFNYIISPRVQLIYGINANNNFIRSLNRLIRNTCYNNKFDQKDSLCEYNEWIEENNKQLRDFIELNIIGIDENDDCVKRSLSDLFTEKYLIYPKFLFYWDSEMICGSITGGVENIIHYEEINLSLMNPNPNGLYNSKTHNIRSSPI